jgi:hypothetical protein
MTILVSDILRRASITLNDEAFVRWTKPELYDWINDGACEIVLRRPAARAVDVALTLVDGGFQALPEDGIELLEVIANVGGRPIKRIDRTLLDNQVPDWRQGAYTDKIRHYMFDEAAPNRFYVYPRAMAGHQVRVLYSAAPPAIAADTDVLQLDRAYIGPIVSYVAYRCYSKDSEYANAQMASGYFQAFSEALGSQNQTTDAASPNTRKP